jgi:hypothetical protein
LAEQPKESKPSYGPTLLHCNKILGGFSEDLVNATAQLMMLAKKYNKLLNYNGKITAAATWKNATIQNQQNLSLNPSIDHANRPAGPIGEFVVVGYDHNRAIILFDQI